jgi:TusA-related sulfurtransferase
MTDPQACQPPGDARTTIDAVGLACPLPIIALARKAAALPAGARIELVTDDPAALHDVPAWCRLRGAAYRGPFPRSAPDQPSGMPDGAVIHLIQLGPTPGAPG